MNWRRGLFRLWIVGSVLFVIAVAFICYSEIKSDAEGPIPWTRLEMCATGEAGDKTKPDRIFGDEEDDGNRRARRLGRQCWRSTCGRRDHGDLSANQLGR